MNLTGRNLMLMRCIAFFLLGAGFIVAGPSAGTGVRAQNQLPTPPGTIRVRVRLVPVDVIVTDSHGQAVTNLTQADFQITENGHPQEIKHFSIQNFTQAAPEPGQVKLTGTAPAQEISPQSARTLLIMMGGGNHQLFGAVDQLIRFVRNDLLPQDRVAVFAYNRATDFTMDHEQIAQVLERYKKYNNIPMMLQSLVRGSDAVYGKKEIPKSIQTEIDKVVANPPQLQSRNLVPALAGKLPDKKSMDPREALKQQIDVMSYVVMPLGETEMERAQIEMITGGLPFGQWRGAASIAKSELGNIFTCIEYLRYMEGEKHLLYFTTSGLVQPYGNSEFDNVIAKYANDARVAIDVFQTGGLDLGVHMRQGSIDLVNYPLSQPGWSWGIQCVRKLSELTGGRAAVYQDIGEALKSVNEATRVEYLLGYYPTDENWDGSYRRINVKVRRPGVAVSFRHGYFASDALEPYDREEFLGFDRITTASTYPMDLRDIQFTISASQALDASGNPPIKVGLQISPARIGFIAVDGKYTGKLRIAAFYSDAKGQNLGEIWETMKLNLSEEDHLKIMKSGIPFSMLVPRKVPNQTIKVVVYDVGSDLLGSRQFQIQ